MHIKQKAKQILHRMIAFKPHIVVVLAVFLVSYVIQSLFHAIDSLAEDPIDHSRLVAVFVDDDIYETLEEELQRYTVNYIQAKIKNSKALVIPIDTDEMFAWDIARVIDNLYFDGEKDASSTLLGAILIGDIPLPVVNDRGYVFPTIYPYVDMEDKLYIFNESSNYFEPNPDGVSSPQAELWHAVIPFGKDVADYESFFTKLQNYVSNPTDFVAKKIWYDDFIQMKETFLHDNVGYYANNFLFTEDIAYQRHTNLMVDLLKQSHEDIVSDTLSALEQAVIPDTSESSDATSDFDQAFGDYADTVNSALEGTDQALEDTEGMANNIPTLFLERTIRELMKPYAELFSSTYRNTLARRIAASGRWTETGAIDSHIEKMSYIDDLLLRNINRGAEPVMVSFNELMQEHLTQQIKSGDYHMNIPLLTRVEIYDKNKPLNNGELTTICAGLNEDWEDYKDLRRIYENYYYGRPAHDITRAIDLTFYRGSYLNITDVNELSSYDYTAFTDGQSDLTSKSIGGSYGFNDRQVMASRGYNALLAEQDQEKYDGHEDIMRGCDDLSMEEFVRSYRGGHSPLNLTQDDNGKITLVNPTNQYAWKPIWDQVLFGTDIGGPLYDIAGARLVDEEQANADSVAAIQAHQNVQKITRKVTGLPGFFSKSYLTKKNLFRYIIPVRYCKLDEREYFGRPIDFFSRFNRDETWVTVFYQDTDEMRVCGGKKLDQMYYPHFKLLDSRQYNTTPNNDELTGMNITTPDRPIDSLRNVTFQGLGGELVRFAYPNLYHVEVFYDEDGSKTLKEPDAIKNSIINYLQDMVDDYNQQLLSQRTKADNYYQQHQDAFDFLEIIDPYATPDRDYDLLDEDFFVDYLGDDALDSLAELLYRQNLPWSERVASENVVDDMTNIITQTDVNHKMRHVFEQYLTKQEEFNDLTHPAYNSGGYEVAYLNSDRQDYLFDESDVPAAIKNLQQSQQADLSRKFLNLGQGSAAQDIANVCGYPITEGLLVFDIKQGKSPRWDAVQCRWEEIKKKPFSIEAEFETNAPIVMSKFLSGIASFVGDRERYQEERQDRSLLYEDRLETEYATQETLAGDAAIVNELATIHHALDMRVDPYSASVDQDAPGYQTPQLRISATKDIGRISMTLSSTGVNCLGVEGIGDSLCEQGQTISFDPYDEEMVVPIIVNGNDVGEGDIILSVCFGDDCIYKRVSISFSQGAVDRVVIDTPLDTAIYESRLPFSLFAYDAFDNLIGLQAESFAVTVDHGALTSQGGQKISFFDFKDAQYVYYAPEDRSIGGDTIKVWKEVLGEDPELVVEKRINLTDASVVFQQNGNTVNNYSYTLPDSNAALYDLDNDDIPQLIPNRLPLFSLQLIGDDGSPVGGYISIQSLNQFFNVGIISSLPYMQGDGEETLYQTDFVSQPDFFVSAEGIDFALYPLGPAGDDVLRASIAGRSDANDLPMEIYHASPYELQISLSGSESNTMLVGDTTTMTVSIKDYRGNIIGTDVPLEIGVFGPGFVDGDQTLFVTAPGVSQYSVTTDDHGGRMYVYAQIAGRDLDQQRAAVQIISVQDSLLAFSGLQTMYLNLRGSDRGNIVDPEKSRFVSDLFANSKQLLAMTTQLLNEGEIYQTPIAITRDYQIAFNYSNQDISLDLSQNRIRVGDIANARLPLYSVSVATGWDDLDVDTIDKRMALMISDDSIDIDLMRNGVSLLFDDTILWNSRTSYADDNLRVVDSSRKNENGHTIRERYYRGSLIGESVLLMYDTLVGERLVIDDSSYSPITIPVGGSTSTATIWGLETDRVYDTDLAFRSLENSNEAEQDIGFLSDFQNITQFAQGLPVAEASQGYSSPLVINIGDGLLERIEDNELVSTTPYDGGPGQRIYSDDGNGILKVIDIDFNNDDLQDMVIAHNDGSVSLLKNYGGDNAYEDLGPLLFVADGIRDVFAGDVDGNGYDDLIIHSSNNRLRVYKNTGGVFDVDGLPICLSISGGPDQLGGLYQFFVKDMDEDGIVDIVINSKEGKIEVFWGGSAGGGDNYVSTIASHCDPAWPTRQDGNVTLVKHRGLEMDIDDVIHDGSLVRRAGLTYDPYPAIDEDSPLAGNYEDNLGYGADPGGDIDIGSIIEGINQTPMDQLVTDAAGDLYRFVASPLGTIPSFDGGLDVADVYYVPLYSLEDNDPVDVYKRYEDVNGGSLMLDDEVLVTVTIEAQESTTLSFVDQIQGPREVVLDQFGYLANFDRGNLPDNAVYIAEKQGSYYYMIENLSLSAGQSVSFSYSLGFVGAQMVKISVDDINADDYQDIKAFPSNACMKVRWDFVNQQNRDFDENLTDLGAIVDQYSQDTQDTMQEAYDELGQSLEDALANMDLSQLAGLGDIGGVPNNMTARDALKDWLLGGGNGSLTLDITGEQGEQVSEFVDSMTKGLCEGFDLGGKTGCKGLPIPFNMAFLAPGIYNIMGCRLMKDKGLPIFHFPGTLQTPIGPIPFPWGQKMNGVDEFYRVGGGVYPSWIRVYLAPTLTMQLGLAVCLGPMKLGMNIPKPFADIAGNCIVTKIPLPVAGCGGDAGSDGDNDGGLEQDWLDMAELGSCDDPALAATQGNNANNHIVSPFTLVSVNGNTTTPSLSPGMYGGGLLQLNMQPVDVLENFDDDSPVSLKGGSPIDLKLQGGNMKGLAQCIVQDWVDRQMKYILNNLSSMAISIYLPDPGNIFQGLGAISFGARKDIYNQENNVDVLIDKELVDVNLDDLEGMEKFYAQMEQSWMPSYSELQDSSQKLGMNPFDALSQLFQQVPLIDVQTKDVTLKVPLVYSNDVNRYASYLEGRVANNGRILKDWTDLAQAVFGRCQQLAGEYSDTPIPPISDANFDPQEYGQKGAILRDGLRESRQAIQNEIEFFKSQPDNTTAQEQLSIRQRKLQTIDECLEYSQDTQLKQFIDFNDNSAQLMQSVRQNINTLELYKRFPLQLSQWIQSTDRYILNIAQFVDGFLGQIANWLDTNSRLFEQWVDAIILLVGAIESRQAIIDLTVNWKKNCSTCTNDNYDYFSCSLSFLCPKLPILPIPPFKIPNIILDASHLDVGIDVQLPKIVFVPEPIPFPELPNLPPPPSISIDALSVDLYVPEIPVIPAPPTLPPLPTFIPRVNLQLATLPPAPAIPKLSTKIEKVLQIGEVIGKLFCIMKGGIGLVAEKSVKSKIEQLTQRTWQVPIFDFFNLTTKRQQPPLQGFDYQIDAFVDFNVNFSAALDAVEQLAGKRNGRVDDKLYYGQIGFNSIQEGLNQAGGAINKMPGSIDINVDPDNLNGYYSADEYESAYEDLERTLAVIRKYDDHSHGDTINRLESLISSRSSFKKKDAGIVKPVRDSFDSIISAHRSSLSELSDMSKDYDRFLARLENKDLPAVPELNKQIVLDLSEGKDEISEQLESFENPYRSYFATQTRIVAGYSNAISQYRSNVASVQEATLIDGLVSSLDQSALQLESMVASLPKTQKNNNTTKEPVLNKRKQVAQNGPSTISSYQFDLARYIKGIYVPGNNESRINIIESDELVDKIKDNYYITELNNDGVDDIVLWDLGSLYIKYGEQQSEHDAFVDTNYQNYYVLNLGNANDGYGDDEGYASSLGNSFKVWDSTWAVHNVGMVGQDFDNITIQRSHHPVFGKIADGYLMRFVTRVDVLEDRDTLAGDISNTFKTKYVLVVPDEGFDSGSNLVLEEQEDAIRDYLGVELHSILYYQDDQERVSLTLTELPRMRHYLQVTALGSAAGSYQQIAPWSRQIVGGQQILADDEGPIPTPTLERDMVGSIVATGNTMQGYVGTYYTLHIQRQDDIAISSAWIISGDARIEAISGDLISLGTLYFTGSQDVTYVIGANDVQGNQTQQEITLAIRTPDIAITGIDPEGDDLISVEATIEHDIDEGFVQFSKRNRGVWTGLVANTPEEKEYREVGPGITVVSGYYFDVGNLVGLYLADDTLIGSINPENGHIDLQGGYDLDVSFETGGPIVFVSDGGAPLFAIYLPPQELLEPGLVLLGAGYKTIALDSPYFGDFYGGICVADESGQCVLYVNMQGSIYVPPAYRSTITATYEFDLANEAVIYHVMGPGGAIADIILKAQSMLF